MKGDFSRYNFGTAREYIAVLKQQGRVDLDSDWNEQSEVHGEHLRQLICDLLGHLAVPLSPNHVTADNSGAFRIHSFSTRSGGVIDFSIGRGLIYAGGYPCWLEHDITFRTQIDYPEPELPSGEGDLLVYLETWLKTVSYVDDEAIREPALGGPDTCLRKKVVAQVKAIRAADALEKPDAAMEYLSRFFRKGSLQLTLRIEESAHQIPITFGEVDVGGSLVPGNLHLRVELHRGVGSGGGFSEGFKWSDENAATVVRVLELPDDNSAVIEEVEAVTGESIKEGDCVEFSNHITEHHRQGGQMVRIESLVQDDAGLRARFDQQIHPLLRRLRVGSRKTVGLDLAPRLRRWSGYTSPLSMNTIYDLGKGVKATFHNEAGSRQFSPGDYWNFPIRDRSYNEKYAPRKSPSDGVLVHRHPLAIIRQGKKKQKDRIVDCRRFFKPLTALD